MKILYLLFSFTTGGTERLVADICNQMVTRNHQIHLYVVNDLYEQSMLCTLDKRVQVHLQKRPAGGGGKLQTLLQVARYIRKHHIQVVHCNSFSAPELLLLKPLCFPGTKIIHTVHDVGQYAGLQKAKRWLRNRLCRRFVAISNCVKEDMIAHGADASKVRVVYNAIDLTRFVPREKTPGDAIRIGQVARIMPEKKGQDLLLEAMAQLHNRYPRLHCYFAGAADAAHQKALTELQAKTREQGLSECVTFLGNVEDVPGFLSTLNIFVLPSRYEGFGISLIEAMAMGVPCIASHLDGPAEVLQGGKYGALFTPGDSRDLADKLEKMLLDPQGCKVKAAEAADYVRNTYDIVTMCDHLEAVMAE